MVRRKASNLVLEKRRKINARLRDLRKAINNEYWNEPKRIMRIAIKALISERDALRSS